MTIRLKLVDGVWYATGTVHLSDGQTVRVRQSTKYTTNQKTFAQAKLNEILAETLASGGKSKARGPSRTIKDIVHLYMRRPKPLGPTDQRVVMKFADMYGDLPIKALTGENIMQFLLHRKKGKTVTSATMRREYAVVLAMLNHAASLDIDVPRLKFKRPPDGENRTRWLVDEERDRLIDALPPEWRAFAAFLFFTGARLGEVERLEWSDVHADHVILKSRKGTGQWRPRAVPLHPDCKAMLAGVPRRSALVFRAPDGGPLDLRMFREQVWAKACKAAKIEDFNPHDARHTFGSRLAQSGVSIVVISELLGHANLDMTKRYMQFAPSHHSSAINNLRGFGKNLANDFLVLKAEPQNIT